jgi:hypothetical protein
LRKYIKQGVEEWQNHLKRQVLKMLLSQRSTNEEEDPDFSPEDMRVTRNSLRSEYDKKCWTSVSDPRSGEIIESDIIWYHNHLRSYRNRYLLETVPQTHQL